MRKNEIAEKLDNVEYKQLMNTSEVGNVKE